jgi:hypothetical protein
MMAAAGRVGVLRLLNGPGLEVLRKRLPASH